MGAVVMIVPPVWPESAGDDPTEPVQEGESWVTMIALEHGELLAKSEIFQH
jgi:hypothetical protein